jgi:hypothetical protein
MVRSILKIIPDYLEGLRKYIRMVSHRVEIRTWDLLNMKEISNHNMETFGC